jgi:hypothetical protein
VQGLATMAADLNGNGNVTASELLAHVRTESESYCARYPCGPGGATPTLEAYAGYDAQVLAAASAPASDASYGAAVASTDVLPTYDAAGAVSVTLPNGGYTRYGDALRIEVKSDKAGQLVVLDIRDDGTTVQLFPNRLSLSVGGQTLIAAGERRFVPGDEDPFRLVPDKRGSGRIVALLVDAMAPIDGITGAYLDLQPIPSPEDYVAALARLVNRAVAYPTGSEAALETPATAGGLARGEAPYFIE